MTEQHNEQITPRYEFRLFSPHLDRVARDIRSRADYENTEESQDYYLITAVNDSCNIKVRDNQLDVKELVQVEQGLEQWRPTLKMDFPLTAVCLQENVFSSLGILDKAELPPEISREMLLDEIVWQHPAIQLARVFKRRLHFTLDGCMVEIGDLLVNFAAIETVAIEAADPEKVLAVQAKLGLQSRENVNYIRALQRIMGLAPASQWQMYKETTNG